ncbi:hypothetical protein ACRALDRAFT_212887 [Sodiomyces alcalophilus JCM 7366]|uniref:uncharacterized protein n=1 Tax=Sodiomyces alcalophilus JCM 7366 TaxID=591952 RepID=UPI0039B61C06
MHNTIEGKYSSSYEMVRAVFSTEFHRFRSRQTWSTRWSNLGRNFETRCINDLQESPSNHLACGYAGELFDSRWDPFGGKGRLDTHGPDGEDPQQRPTQMAVVLSRSTTIGEQKWRAMMRISISIVLGVFTRQAGNDASQACFSSLLDHPHIFTQVEATYELVHTILCNPWFVSTTKRRPDEDVSVYKSWQCRGAVPIPANADSQAANQPLHWVARKPFGRDTYVVRCIFLRKQSGHSIGIWRHINLRDVYVPVHRRAVRTIAAEKMKICDNAE